MRLVWESEFSVINVVQSDHSMAGTEVPHAYPKSAVAMVRRNEQDLKKTGGRGKSLSRNDLKPS
jgi:hypothetical protein